MSTNTTNYKFTKPDLTDPADIRVMNDNWDKVDAELKKKIELDETGKIPSEKLPDKITSTSKYWLVSVETTGWTLSNNMYVKTINVSEMKANYNPTYGLKPAGNYATEGEEEAFAAIKGLVTASGNITLYATEAPTTQITLSLKGV